MLVASHHRSSLTSSCPLPLILYTTNFFRFPQDEKTHSSSDTPPRPEPTPSSPASNATPYSRSSDSIQFTGIGAGNFVSQAPQLFVVVLKEKVYLVILLILRNKLSVVITPGVYSGREAIVD